MKAVLISIQPKWCERIVKKKKTVEVRKTRPNMDVPFKCYIYCTKKFYRKGDGYFQGKYCGKVIGEFVCNRIIEIKPFGIDDIREFEKQTCLKANEIVSYLNGFYGYGWHISELVIYDEPRELREFITICSEWEKEYFTNKCLSCKYYFSNCADMRHECTVEGEKPITRPPQSWRYVEELRSNEV